MVDYASPSSLDCPRCHKPSLAPDGVCSSCEAILGYFDDFFGGDRVRLERLADPENVIQSTSKENLIRKIAELEKQSSGIRVIVFLTQLPEGILLDDFMFWLLNRGFIPEQEGVQDCRFALLIGIAINRQEVGMNAGDGVFHEYPELESSMLSMVRVLAGQLKVVSVDLALTEALSNLKEHLIKSA